MLFPCNLLEILYFKTYFLMQLELELSYYDTTLKYCVVLLFENPIISGISRASYSLLILFC